MDRHIDRTLHWPERRLVALAMLRPADRGGVLRITVQNEPVDVDLRTGDVIVFCPWLAHEITPVEAGGRIVWQGGLLDYR